jgi:3-hydroxybutyryl-CoA dehydratase
VIASGTHTSALLLGLTATHFSKRGSVVGLEFTVRFRRAVFADEAVRVEWDVIKVTPNAKLKGEIVDMLGRLTGSDGVPAVEAEGRVLVTDRL